MISCDPTLVPVIWGPAEPAATLYELVNLYIKNVAVLKRHLYKRRLNESVDIQI